MAAAPTPPLPLLDHYILRQLLVALLALTGGAVALIWLTQSLHFVTLIVQHGLSLRAFLHLTLLMAPSFAVVILPVTTFLVILFLYQKLAGDRELTVMHAAGLSTLRLARPGLLCALAATGASLVLSLWLAPVSYHAFHAYEFQIRNRLAAFLLEEGVFTHVSETMTIYIHKRDGSNAFQGVMIQDNRDPANPVTVLAERGAMVPDALRPRLVLYNGSRQVLDRRTRQLAMLNFDHNMVDLTTTRAGAHQSEDAAELPLGQLLHPPAQLSQHVRNKWRVEGLHRLTGPLSAFSYSVIALVCVLRGRFSKHGNFWRPLLAIFLVVGLLTFSLMLKSMTARTPALAPLMVTLALLPGMIGLLCLFFDGRRTRPARPA
ncbi:LPS export ABC transporter permease LptF [Oecophyllibacter saccharovorans]|uniref:LPS export ABC transporter permease LptF n=1 Tax=Oecophyllibacter saccharovorans TaxID=2558360 RepID=UPI001143926C|nr:LPS export ABC transporter permease LptF [Oecophyllibacter saccharovorans]QDH14752.1 LPS export ABC transporter permease LptF [Oecophyllibacter saccharovorans]